MIPSSLYSKLFLTAVIMFFVSATEEPVWGEQASVPATDWTSREIVRFRAIEANQGVAVDEEFFYAIDNRRIGKYRKVNGEKVAEWKDEQGGSFIHLNSGFIKDGKLIVSHSNFPGVPMFSSVEIWDIKTMKHIGSHSFGIGPGSLTWIAYRNGFQYACFADYTGGSGNPGKGPAYTQLVRYDDQWRAVGGWGFPAELVQKFGNSSASCGAFGPGGLLYVTGHDAKEIYVLDFPKGGSILQWIATIPAPLEGQAFSWDPEREHVVYGIVRKTKEVVVFEIEPGSGVLPKF